MICFSRKYVHNKKYRISKKCENSGWQPEMEAGSAKKIKSQKKGVFPKNDFISRKKKLPFLPFLRVFKAFKGPKTKQS